MPQQPSDKFCENVKRVWGDSEKVASVGFDEIFLYSDNLSLDYDDQIFNALKIGVLAGKTATTNPEYFIEEFTIFLNKIWNK